MEENRKDEVARDQGETDIDIRGDDGGEMERVNREVDREREMEGRKIDVDPVGKYVDSLKRKH